MWVVALGIALTLAATSSAEAAGFNVNSHVSFAPLTSTYRTSDTTGCPAGFSGKFTFTALLTNKTEQSGDARCHGARAHADQRQRTARSANQRGPRRTGRRDAVPKAGQYADGLLSPGESVNVPFVLCLKAFQPFQFFVDVFGVVTQLVSVNRFGTGSVDRPSGVAGDQRRWSFRGIFHLCKRRGRERRQRYD